MQGTPLKKATETYLCNGIYKDEYGRLFRRDDNFIFMLNLPESRKFKENYPEYFV